jgi:hypothetical protein
MEHLYSPLSVERDDVVGPLQGSSKGVVESIPLHLLFQLGFDLPSLNINHPDKPDHLTLLSRLFPQRAHFLVTLLETLHVLFLALAFGESGGDERSCGQRCVTLGQGRVGQGRVGDETRKDGKFSSDIRAGKIIPWVRFL